MPSHVSETHGGTGGVSLLQLSFHTSVMAAESSTCPAANYTGLAPCVNRIVNNTKPRCSDVHLPPRPGARLAACTASTD